MRLARLAVCIFLLTAAYAYLLRRSGTFNQTLDQIYISDQIDISDQSCFILNIRVYKGLNLSIPTQNKVGQTSQEVKRIKIGNDSLPTFKKIPANNSSFLC